MIRYFCKLRYADTMLVFLTRFSPRIAGQVGIVPYEYLHRIREFRPGSFVFTDLDRITADERSRAIELHAAIGEQSPGSLRLNDPARSLLRFDLLKLLFRSGLNEFDVYRLDQAAEVRRFPVFVRRELGHGKMLTGLLQTSGELTAAINRLMAERAVTPDLMIVELGARPAADGFYRRYGAQLVARALYPHIVFRGHGWMVKYKTSDHAPAAWSESSSYMPSAAEDQDLRTAFDLANISYGRADFASIGGRVQIFEINTNPLVVTAAAVPFAQQIYAERHDSALEGIAIEPGGPAIRNPAALGAPFWRRRSVRYAHRASLRRFEAQLLRQERRASAPVEL